MKISEPLILELLELTRMYVDIPFNSIFAFTALEQCRNLEFFESNIYTQMIGGWRDYGPKVRGLLRDIYSELENSSKD